MKGQMANPRPVGVTVIAVLNLIGAFLTAPFTLMYVFLFFVPGGGESGQQIDRMGRVILLVIASLLCLLCGLLAVASYGLLKLRNWARVLTIVVGTTILLGSVVSLVTSSLVWQALWGFAYAAPILWYLSRARIRRLFFHPSRQELSARNPPNSSHLPG
jgi:hypothetical protein